MKKITTFILSLLIFTNGYTQCPVLVSPSNINISNDVNSCGAVVLYDEPFVIDTCSSIGFFEDFELGFSGWTTSSFNGINNWSIQDFSGAGTLLGSNMLGVPHAGNYAYGGTEHSYIQSPIFNTLGGGKISFDFFVNNEPSVHDQEMVQISYNGGVTWNQVMGNQLPNNEFNSQSTNIIVSVAEGSESTLLRFIYNTVDACCGAQDGFFVDNVKFEKNTLSQLISGLGSGSVFPIGISTEVYEVINGENIDTILFTITVNSTHNSTQNLIICYGETVSVGLNNYSNSGTYFDTLATILGCDSVLTTNLLVKNNIDTTLFIDDRLIVSNEMNADYQWITCSSSNLWINGEINREYVANTDGNFAVIITKDGCTKTSSIANIMSVAVAENKIANIVKYYPNPVIDKVTIELNHFISNTSISIVDITSKELFKIDEIVTTQVELDLSSFSSGIYFVKIGYTKKQEILKLVKK